MTVIAKFQCNAVTSDDNGVSVSLNPVYHENDPDHPNYKYWTATPSGSLTMYITNTSAADQFVQGGVYTLTLERDPPADGAQVQSDDGSQQAAGDLD